MREHSRGVRGDIYAQMSDDERDALMHDGPWQRVLFVWWPAKGRFMV
jgi:hypothetical protein